MKVLANYLIVTGAMLIIDGLCYWVLRPLEALLISLVINVAIGVLTTSWIWRVK